MARSLIREEQVTDTDFVAPHEHEELHDKDIFIEVVRENNKISIVNEWRDSSKSFMYSSTAIERTDNKVSKTIKTIYDYFDGTTVIATVTGTIHRNLNKSVADITFDRDIDHRGLET